MYAELSLVETLLWMSDLGECYIWGLVWDPDHDSLLISQTARSRDEPDRSFANPAG